MREHGLVAAAVAAAAVVATPGLAGECVPDWDRTVGTAGVVNDPGTNGYSRYVGAFAAFDDGDGEALYFGGPFDNVAGICGTQAIAKWTGTTYEALDLGAIGGYVSDMVVFDDGTGPALFVAGTFTSASNVPGTAGIAKWDGTQWHSVASSLGTTAMFGVAYATSLAVWDDGTGPALYIGGRFDSIDGVDALNIAKYDGTTFTPLLGGVGPTQYWVNTLEVYNNKLIVGGRFTQFDNGAMGGVESARNLAEWNGTTWEQVAEWGIDSAGAGYVNDVVVHDDGTGAKLYIGGRSLLSPNFNDPLDFTGMLVWDGGDTSESVTSVGVALPDTVVALGVFDDGSDGAVYAGRQYGNSPGRPENFVKLTSTGWVAVGGDTDGGAYGMMAWDDGNGMALYVGGAFRNAGGAPAGGLAVWTGGPVNDPAGWDRAIGSVASAPVYGISNGHVNAMAFREFAGWQDFGYIGGSFSSIGGVCSTNVAYWDPIGQSFGAMGQGVWNPSGNSEVLAIEVFNDGVYVGGTFQTASHVPNTSGLAMWNGGSWEAVAEFGFFLDAVRAMTIWDDGSGPALYIAGQFTNIRKPGDEEFIAANAIVKYDGTTFTTLGTGFGAGSIVQDLEVFQGKLYAAGRFFNAGGVSVQGFAAWDGTSWSRPDQFRLERAFMVNDLQVFDDGTGEKLYLAGRNMDVIEDPDNPTNPNLIRTSVASYDGGTELDSFSYDGVLLPDLEARALAVYHDELYVGGAFSTAASYFAKLTDTGWETVGGGTDAAVNTLFVWDDDTGEGEQLYVGGSFVNAGGEAASGVAAWTGCPAAVCPCEMDGNDAQVDVFDLLAYLDLWFAADEGADIDGQAGVDVFDLLAYLDCWFPASAGAPCP